MQEGRTGRATVKNLLEVGEWVHKRADGKGILVRRPSSFFLGRFRVFAKGLGHPTGNPDKQAVAMTSCP